MVAVASDGHVELVAPGGEGLGDPEQAAPRLREHGVLEQRRDLARHQPAALRADEAPGDPGHVLERGQAGAHPLGQRGGVGGGHSPSLSRNACRFVSGRGRSATTSPSPSENTTQRPSTNVDSIAEKASSPSSSPVSSSRRWT